VAISKAFIDASKWYQDVPKSPRTLYDKVVNELDGYFNPNKHSQSAQNETERKISLNSANSSRSATPVPSDTSGKEVR
jgi:hypothetical protein